jgi:glutathione peroxidase
MKQILAALIVFFISNQGISQQLMNFHDLEAVTIGGDSISLSQYAGKKLLVVNTASYCGYTHQFNDLEALYLQYGGTGFEIIGFPCNDFGSQDPGSDSTILDFCTGNYNVTFQMMSRISINTGDTSAVYKWLQRGNLNGVSDAAVTWNFNKFLVDKKGSVIGRFSSDVSPTSKEVTDLIEKSLK